MPETVGKQMKKIRVNGRLYEVIEDLPYHGVGMPTKMVRAPGLGDPKAERVAVRQGGVWRFWSPRDRLAWGDASDAGSDA